MHFKITHTTSYAYSDAVPVCHNMVHLAPRTAEQQKCVSYRLLIVPEPSERSYHEDFFGNRVDFFSIQKAHRGLTVTATSLVDVADSTPPTAEDSPPWEELAQRLAMNHDHSSLANNPFRFASTLVPVGSRYAEYARVSFQPGRPIVSAGQDLTARIHQDFKYDPRATTVATPVDEVLAKRAGVCQDFAHLQISCFRSLGLAARYVSGYLRTVPAPGKPRLVGADESHAWVSLYCGERGWIGFDPTNNTITASDHVTVALGRDYHDCCPIRGVSIGGGEQTMSVSVDVMPTD